MEIDYGDKRSQIIIAGILVICVVAIFVGFALVIGGFKTDSQISILQSFDKILNNSELGGINYNTDVSAGKCGCIDDVPTKQGEISYLSGYFPPASWTELPLCITDTDMVDWFITLTVAGGYEPQGGFIEFTQEDKVQKIFLRWSEHEYCCYSEWTATFVTDDGCLEFMSSSLPTIDLPFDFCGPCGSIDDKLVDIFWKSCWIGCDFCIMLTHKRYLSGIPQLPIVIHRQL